MRTITGLRIGAAAASVGAGTLVALAVIPGNAGAAFDPSFNAACQGDLSIAGRGASFQRSAQLAWGASSVVASPAPATAVGFGYAPTSAGGCSLFKLSADGGSQTVSFDPQGSGEGRGVVGATTSVDTAPNSPKGAPGVRKTDIQFAAADEPPKPAQILAANMGPDQTAGTADDAVLYTVPVLQGAVATIVRLPDGCSVPNTAAGHSITRAALEGAFNGSTDYTQWGQILPSITGDGCATKAFKRVVRFDSSGTTYGLKNYLRDIKPGDFPTSQDNTVWPNDTGATAVVRPAVNGGGALADTLTQQTANGGIGYVDLATARTKGFDTESGAAGDTDKTIWLNVERKGDGTFKSPALADTKGTTNTGANCVNVTYADVTTGGLPSVTGSWYDVTSSSSAADYPICVLSYALVWEDMAKANVGHAAGLPDYTQGQARAVKDYLGYALNPAGGQAALPGAGFQALPASIDTVSRNGQAALTWNKATTTPPPTGGGGGTTTTTPTTPTTPVTTPTTPVTTPTTPVTTPTTPKPAPAPAASTSVKASKAAAVKGRKVALTVSVGGKGKVAVSATTGSGKKKTTVLTGSATATKSGAVKVTLKPSSKGKKALKAGRSIKISFKVTFTNADGVKKTTTKTIKVKIKG